MPGTQDSDSGLAKQCAHTVQIQLVGAQTKKYPARFARARPCECGKNTFKTFLEDQLHPQLNFPRVMSSSDCPEVAGREGIADVFELRVVKRVEGFRA
jgi:hypothetical protein